MDAAYDAWRTGRSDNPLIVAPCGAGKSIIIAALCHEALTSWPETRILLLTHRRELLTQNGAELLGLWPDAPIGYYSAGLNRKDTAFPVLFAGIQSIWSKVTEFDPWDLVIIDEAHLVPRSIGTQYGSAIENLKLMNPDVRVLGLTATPYRLDAGMLHEGPGALFDSIVYDIPVQDLIDQGHLVEIVAKGGQAKADLSGVHRRSGDFVAAEMEAAFDQFHLVEAACKEIVQLGADRKAWLVFAAGVDHAEHVRDELRRLDIDAEMVTGSTPKEERDRLTARFRSGGLRCLVNVAVLTTGANFPICDMLVLLRATESTSLFVQIVGRGMRVSPGKANCLLLDFGGNCIRHGPIDDVKPKAPGSGGGPAPSKECPSCHSIVAAGRRECPDCGYLFPEREIKHATRAYEGAVLKAQMQPDWRKVDHVGYARHIKAGRPDSCRVDYYCGIARFSDWLCIDHGGHASELAWHKLKIAGMKVRPNTVSELLARTDELASPTEILIKPEGKYVRIEKYRYSRKEN